MTHNSKLLVRDDRQVDALACLGRGDAEENHGEALGRVAVTQIQTSWGGPAVQFCRFSVVELLVNVPILRGETARPTQFPTEKRTSTSTRLKDRQDLEIHDRRGGEPRAGDLIVDQMRAHNFG